MTKAFLLFEVEADVKDLAEAESLTEQLANRLRAHESPHVTVFPQRPELDEEDE